MRMPSSSSWAAALRCLLRVSPDRRLPLDKPRWSADVPLVVTDLASVETYLLVRALSDLAAEEDGAVWCPLISGPAPLDLDVDTARRYATRLQVPFVRPELHPAPVPRAMRIAALAAARGRGAIFTIMATRLAWATGADLNRLDEETNPEEEEVEANLEEYLRLIVQRIGIDFSMAKLAAEESSDWDVELRAIASSLAQAGIHTAPALRWHGRLYNGLVGICAVLSESGRAQPSLD